MRERAFNGETSTPEHSDTFGSLTTTVSSPACSAVVRSDHPVWLANLRVYCPSPSETLLENSRATFDASAHLVTAINTWDFQRLRS
jgi:hypothetical protein